MTTTRTLILRIVLSIACTLSFLPRSVARDLIGRLAPVVPPALTTGDLSKIQAQLRVAREKVLPSIVNVLQPDKASPAGASGTIIDPNGLILTHCHSGQTPGKRVQILLSDGRKVGGEYLGCHRPLDLALIRIDERENGPFPAIEISSGDDLGVGDVCFALSYPASYFPLSQEPLLRVSRVLEVLPHEVYTGTHLQSGDSGGGLFTIDGKLIGVHSGSDGPNSNHSRADLYASERDDLVKGRLILGGQFAEPISREELPASVPKVSNAVVRLLAGGKQRSLGFVVGSDGWIVSTALAENTAIECELHDGRRLPATVESVDSIHPLSLIKIDASGLPVASLSKRKTKVGQLVATVGPNKGLLGLGVVGTPLLSSSPKQKTGSLKVFIHSGLSEKNLPGVLGRYEIQESDLGSPVVDSQGDVIGINVGRLARKNHDVVHAAAIPADRIRNVLSRLKKDLQLRGEVRNQVAVANHIENIESKVAAVYNKVAPSTVAIYNAQNGYHVGSGTVISSDGLVLTHAVAHIGKKRIGRTFNIKLGDGRITTGKYLGVHRGFRMALMQLDGDGPWPCTKIGESAKLEPQDHCLIVSYPSGYDKKDRPPLLRLSRVLGITDTEIFPAAGKLSNGDIGGAMFNVDGEMVGMAHNFRGFVRADRYQGIRRGLLDGKFTRKHRLPVAFDTSHLASLAGTVNRSVVRVHCDGEDVMFGLIVSPQGHIITKASQLKGDVTCVLTDKSRLAATRKTISWEHDIALLKVEATGLPVASWAKQPAKVGAILATIGMDEHPLAIGTLGGPVIAVDPDKGALGFKVRASKEGEGVVVTEILFGATDQVLKAGDIITSFNNTAIGSLIDFRDARKRFYNSRQAIAGAHVAVRVKRDDKTMQIELPIESQMEANRGRLVGAKFPPPLHTDLRGRQTGFASVFLHDALIRRPPPQDVFTPRISRKDFGSPVVNLDGKITGLNIGSHLSGLSGIGSANFAYAIPVDVVCRVVQQLVERSTSAK